MDTMTKWEIMSYIWRRPRLSLYSVLLWKVEFRFERVLNHECELDKHN